LFLLYFLQVTESQQYALIEYISHLVNNDFEAVAKDLFVLGFIPEGSDPEKTSAVVEPLSRVLGQLVQGGGAKYVNLAQVKTTEALDPLE
jgi:tyrosine-protein phosphatase YwqE